MRQTIDFSVLLSTDGKEEDAAANVVSILENAGASLVSRGRQSLSFRIDAELFDALFGLEGAQRCSVEEFTFPAALEGLVDLISISKCQIVFPDRSQKQRSKKQ